MITLYCITKTKFSGNLLSQHFKVDFDSHLCYVCQNSQNNFKRKTNIQHSNSLDTVFRKAFRSVKGNFARVKTAQFGLM